MRFEHLGFAPDYVDYQRAWDYQREVHAKVAAGELENTTLLLEHQAVYTAGKMTQPFERPFDGTPVVDVDRGGKITWHGPGQLVGYPIVRLAAPINVVGYVRLVEEVMIRTAAELGVQADRVEGRSGIWILGHGEVPDRKMGAIGIRVSKQVTMHGFALNVDCDLSWSQTCIPCGITDAGVTTLAEQSGQPLTVPDVVPIITHHLEEVLSTVSTDRRAGTELAAGPGAGASAS